LILAGGLSAEDPGTLHRATLRVLGEVGVRVEHPGVVDRLRAYGAVVGGDGQRVFLPHDLVEAAVEAQRSPQPPGRSPAVGLYCGIYNSVYLDTMSGELRPFDEPALADYIGLARRVAGPSAVGMLGLPFLPASTSGSTLPLLEKLFCWKWGANPDGSVHLTALCEPLMDLFRCHADATGRALDEVFVATGYLISPLRLARPECEQLLYFAERGLRMGIGHMPSQGGSVPVSFAGAVALTVAERLFLHILELAMWGDGRLGLGSVVTTMDYRRCVSCLGRPEMHRITAALADMARFYGCDAWGGTALSDAKTPSCEAGAQKAIGTLAGALAAGSATIAAGLLAMDEVCSPVQMVMDADIAAAVNVTLARPSLDGLDAAVEEIARVGPGGSFIATDETARTYRRELWEPRTWEHLSLAGWAAAAKGSDVDRAKARALELMQAHPPTPLISEEHERELWMIVKRAHAPPRSRED